MIYQEGRDEERRSIERAIDMMSEEELKKWCKDNLYFDEDYCRDRWTIDAENIQIDREWIDLSIDRG